jgi:hypothetical protein
MTFPIYNCGKLSFKDGKPLFNPDCCCWLIPCCSDCYFPVANRAEDVPSLGVEGAQVGGPSTISGFYALIQDLTAGVDSWYEQDGVSTHAIRKGFISIDDNCDYMILTSRCFWTIRANAYNSIDGFLFNIGITITYGTTTGWQASVEGSGFFTGPVFLGQCAGNVTWSNDYVSPTLHDVHEEGIFTCTGGKAWPTGFVCNGHSSREGLFNVAENRLAVTTDFPVGWF